MPRERDNNSRFQAETQPGLTFTQEELGARAFFGAVRNHRYSLEPHIPGIAQFGGWAGRDVLEVDYGLGTDGAGFDRVGAICTGYDRSREATSLARQRLDLEVLEATFTNGDAAYLPFCAQFS